MEYLEVCGNLSHKMKVHAETSPQKKQGLLTIYAESEWLSTILSHISSSQLTSRLKKLSSSSFMPVPSAATPPRVHYPTAQIYNLDLLINVTDSSYTPKMFDEILRQMHRLRPADNFAIYFRNLYAVARKGSKKDQQRLLHFLADMQFENNSTNQALRAILEALCLLDTLQGKVKQHAQQIIQLIEQNPTEKDKYKHRNILNTIIVEYLELARNAGSSITNVSHLSSVSQTVLPLIELSSAPIQKMPLNISSDGVIEKINAKQKDLFDVPLKKSKHSPLLPLSKEIEEQNPYLAKRHQKCKEDFQEGCKINDQELLYTLKNSISLQDFEFLDDEIKKLQIQTIDLQRQIEESARVLPKDKTKRNQARLRRIGEQETPPTFSECLHLFSYEDQNLYRQNLPWLEDDQIQNLHKLSGEFLEKATSLQQLKRSEVLLKQIETSHAKTKTCRPSHSTTRRRTEQKKGI